ncbi:MAG: glycosyltransferase [Planctomycetia bacterium]|nr:glycosyltransferase [Planctomycetia bacterium]
MHTVDGTYQGIRTHVLEIFSRVVALCPQVQFYLFLENPTTLSDFSNNFNSPNVKTIRIPVSSPFLRLIWFFLKMQKKYHLDYFHSQYIFPFPLLSKGLVTIHDILFETHTQYFSTIFKIRLKLLVKYAAKKSEHIFSVSNFSKESIIKNYDINPDKITVIYNAASSIYSNKNNKQNILNNFSLKQKKYLLTVGRSDVRKNYHTLIRAYSSLINNIPPLLIIDSSSDHSTLNHLIAKYNLNHKIKIISNINNEVLSEIYKNATLFIYPSYAEGFGIPVIEAMTSGLCVIASNTTALREIGQGAVVFINPNNPNEIANTIQTLLKDVELRKKHEILSINRASEFSWDESAHKVAEIYNSLY